MKIKFGAIVTDGRGKLGGHVASKNRSGAYLRTKVTPANPQTSAQTSTRNKLGTYSAGWGALTDAQRASFNNAVVSWARTDIFGDLKNPTGKNLYTKLNINLANAGYPAITEAPEKVEIFDINILGVVIDISAQTISFDGVDGISDSTIQVGSTGVLSAGTSFTRGKFRVIDYQLDGNVTTMNPWVQYVARYGTPALGQNIHFEWKQIGENGQSNVAVSAKAQINA